MLPNSCAKSAPSTHSSNLLPYSSEWRTNPWCQRQGAPSASPLGLGHIPLVASGPAQVSAPDGCPHCSRPIHDVHAQQGFRVQENRCCYCHRQHRCVSSSSSLVLLVRNEARQLPQARIWRTCHNTRNATCKLVGRVLSYLASKYSSVPSTGVARTAMLSKAQWSTPRLILKYPSSPQFGPQLHNTRASVAPSKLLGTGYEFCTSQYFPCCPCPNPTTRTACVVFSQWLCSRVPASCP